MRVRPLATLAFAVAAASVTTGCHDQDAAARALNEAEATLAALHDSPPPAGFVRSTYQSIRGSLAPALEGGTEAQRSAAQLLTGQSHAGDAELAALDAAGIERESTRRQAQAQTLAGRLYVWRLARADAEGSYDPAAEIASIDEQIAGAQTDRAAAQARFDAAQQSLEALQQQARDGAERARTLRAAEATQRDTLLATDGPGRAEAAQRVFEAQREADAADQSVADTEAEIAVAQALAAERARAVAGTERLIELLRASRASLLERETRGTRLAQADRDQASATAAEIEKLLTDLDELRSGALAEAYRSAEQSFQKAASALRGVAGGGTSAPLWLGATQHAMAEVNKTRAASEIRYASFLEGLSAAGARLPYAGQLDSRAKAAREHAASLDAASRDAYRSAAGAFQRAARGPQADALRALADSLSAEADAGSAQGDTTPSDL